MTRKKKPLPILENVEIADIAAEGKALAKVDDFVVFVPWVAPGDVVDIQLTRKKHSYAEGRAVRFHKYSPERAQPFCEHFAVCGGCKWQHLPYEAQLRYKQKQVFDNLTRIGKVEIEEMLPIIGSEQTTCYRNKIEYTFSDRRWLSAEEFAAKTDETQMNGAGFHIPGMFDKVLDIRKCWLQDDISNRIRMFAKDFCIKRHFDFYNVHKHSGFIRTLVVRTSTTGELMVIAIFAEDSKGKRELLLNAVKSEFPEITSLIYIINTKLNDTFADLDAVLFSGKDHLAEEMGGLKFKVGPKSFYQTNSRQAHRLYSVALDFADAGSAETVYDLYTGTGTIANFVARKAKKVVGIEYVPEAIEDAKTNAKLNDIDNVEFFAGDMKDILNKDFIAKHGHPDVIITDPPRTGMHDDVTGAILAASPERIVYVSCNPATQARDLAKLGPQYRVRKVQPVDMFPHTQHVENVVLLQKR